LILTDEFFLGVEQDSGYSSSVWILDLYKTVIVEEGCPLFLELFGLEHLSLRYRV